MIRRSIATKIVLWTGLAIALVIGFSTFTMICVQRNAFLAQAKHYGQTLSNFVLLDLREAMLTGNRSDLEKNLKSLSSEEEFITVDIYDRHGQVHFSSHPGHIGKQVQATDNLDKTAQPTHSFSKMYGKDMLTVITPIYNERSCQNGGCHPKHGKILGALNLGIAVPTLGQIVSNTRNMMIILAGVSVCLVSLLISVLIIRFVGWPVKSLVDTMSEVESGNLQARAAISHHDELGRLGSSFNSMIGSLQEAKQELQKVYEQQVERAERLASVGQLVSGIAHEIRNPLAGISSAIQVLVQEESIPEAERGIMQDILKRIEHMNKVIKNVLSFVRPVTPNMTACDVQEIVQRVVFLVKKQAERQGIEIKEDLNMELPAIWVDHAQIEQVLLNIAINGIQAMPEGGTLKMSTGYNAEKKEVFVKLADTGIGMSHKIRKKIFDPFFTTKHGGTGLGLSITQRIISQHGGRLSVESEEGKGTIFIVELPIAQSQNAAVKLMSS